jgi:hypothetical protein
MSSSADWSSWEIGSGILGPWAVVLGALLLVEGGGLRRVQAQAPSDGRRDSLALVHQYRMARYRLLARRVAAAGPLRTLPPEPIPTATDTLVGAPPPDTAAAPPTTDPSFSVEDVRAVHHLEKTWFRTRYGGTKWAFLGTGPRLSFLDTTYTRDLRARLQARFGPPTRTPADVNLDAWRQTPDSSRDALPQFAYWFVVNDSIPVRVTDVEGPRGRGLIVSADRAYRDRLRALRTALLGSLRREERAPYVDYYYDEATRRWYRVGFDGQAFFRERISRFDIVRGRRPRLDTVRTAPAAPTDPSQAPGSP